MEKKENWSNKSAFLFAMIGSAVGLGNIWRYPYQVYENGGGTFLIPYFVAIVTAGIPLIILETTIGHKYRHSAPLSLKAMNKKFEWLGWFPVMVCGIVLSYYSVIVGWSLNYMLMSVGKVWGSDPNTFFSNSFLQSTSSGFDFGHFTLFPLMGLAVVWILVWLTCYKGIKGIARLNKIVLPLLFVLMIFIVISSLFLPGAAVGLNVLFTPQWDKLGDPSIWIAAYGQVFFSLSLASAMIITYSSYLPKKSDISNGAVVMAFSNCTFEFITSIGVFAILGFMATKSNVPVDEVVTSGIGLSFISFPECFNQMPGIVGNIIGFAFFGCMLFAGITSVVSLFEAFCSGFIDKFNFSRKKCVTIICIVGFCISSIYTTGAGIIILDIVDAFINYYGFVLIGLLECVCFGWFFGLKPLREHANSVSYFKIARWWDICIKYITPVILLVTLLQETLLLITSGYGGHSTAELLVYGVGVSVGGMLIALMLTLMKPRQRNS